MSGGCFVNGTCFFSRRGASLMTHQKCPGGCYDGATNSCKYPYDPLGDPAAVECMINNADGCYANGACYTQPFDFDVRWPRHCIGGCTVYETSTKITKHTARCVYHVDV